MQEEAPKHTATALEQPRPGGQRIHPINDAPHSEAASELFPLAACDCDNDGAVIVTICGLYG